MGKITPTIRIALLVIFGGIFFLGGYLLKAAPPIEKEGASEDIHSLFEKAAVKTIREQNTIPENAEKNELWLNSGALLSIENGVAKTIQGPLPFYSRWKAQYAQSNPSDTENGLYPQNVFRLITTRMWQNASQKVAFKVHEYRKTMSANRNDSNGVLLMSRYHDDDTLY